MSATERLDHQGNAVRPPVVERSAEPFGETLTGEAVVRTSRLRPLLALGPYVGRYRGRAILALISLTIAAATTLIVPSSR